MWNTLPKHEQEKAREFEPQTFLNQFDFVCKYNKNFNRHSDCSDYQSESKKEILISLERQKSRISILTEENKALKMELTAATQKH